MLAMADANGFIEASAGGLAHRARVSKDDCLAALETLASPDPESKNPDFEGRRIERVAGGWAILSAQRYRDRRTKKQIQTLERVRRHRAKRYGALRTATMADVTTEVEVEVEVEEKTTSLSSTDISTGSSSSKGTGGRPKPTRQGAEAAFAVWVATLPESSRSLVKLTKPRQARYDARIREGYSHETILQALRRYVYDPWEVRLTSSTARDFATILRSGANVEKFSAMMPADKNGHRKARPGQPIDHETDARRVNRVMELDD